MDIHLPREQHFLRFLVSGLRLSAASQRRSGQRRSFPAFELTTCSVSMQFRQGYERIASNGIPEWLFRWSKGEKKTVVATTSGAPSLTECDTLSPELWQQPLVFSDLGLKHCLLHYNLVALQSVPDVHQLQRWIVALNFGDVSKLSDVADQGAIWLGACNGDLLISFALQKADGLQPWQHGPQQKRSDFRLKNTTNFLLQHGLLNPLVQFENPAVWFKRCSSEGTADQLSSSLENPWSHLFEPALVFLLPFLVNQKGWNQWLQSLLREPADNPNLDHISLLISAAESAKRMDVLRPLIYSVCALFTSASVVAFTTELGQQLTTHYDTMAQVERHRKGCALTLGKLVQPFAAITQLEALPTFERRPDQQQLLYWCTELELYAALHRARALQESLSGRVGSQWVSTSGLSFT